MGVLFIEACGEMLCGITRSIGGRISIFAYFNVHGMVIQGIAAGITLGVAVIAFRVAVVVGSDNFTIADVDSHICSERVQFNFLVIDDSAVRLAVFYEYMALVGVVRQWDYTHTEVASFFELEGRLHLFAVAGEIVGLGYAVAVAVVAVGVEVGRFLNLVE